MRRPIPDEFSFAQLNDDFFVEKVELVELLMYPLKKKHPHHFEKIDWSLFDIWKKICSKYMIDNEYRYIYYDHFHSYVNQEPWEDEIEEVRRAKSNAEGWIKTAKKEMIILCAPLYSLIANKVIYPKHYPRFRESHESMKNRSQSNDAVLLLEYTSGVQDMLFNSLIELRFPIILTNKDSVFVIERNKLTGYSEGKECTKLVCKISLTSSLVHFYPIHNDELFKYQKVYKNPIFFDPVFELNELDDNIHIKGNVLNNFVEII